MSKALMIVVPALLLTPLAAGSAGAAQIPLAPTGIPQFVDPLPIPRAVDVTGGAPLTLAMCEFQSSVLPTGTIPGYTGTWTWGYQVGTQCPTTPQQTYLGPVLVARRNVPTEITFINNLGNTATSNVLAYTQSTDQTLHWADPLNAEENLCNMEADMSPGMLSMQYAGDTRCGMNYAGPIPAVPHLHGGEVPPVLDGGPDAWFTSDGSRHGHGFYSKDGNTTGNYAIYRYPNTQEASPIWFHDHTLGATRLNVYAGLAGGYLITDPGLALPPNLPGPGDIIPLVIQDRMFDVDGQLIFQAGNAGGILWALNPEHPYWSPEFLGDVIMVNGKAWPKKDVEPRRYRVLFLNGSNARTYELFLIDPVSKNPGPPLWIIGTDGGYLDTPVKIDPAAPKPAPTKLVIMPGERYEAIIDFGGYQAGVIGPNGSPYSGKWTLKNVAKAPYPGGMTPEGNTTGRIMQFVVGACGTGQCGLSDPSYDPAGGIPLRTGGQTIARLVNPATGTPAVAAQKTRLLTLNEVMGMPRVANGIAYPGGPLEVLVNNTKWSGKRPDGSVRSDFAPVTINGVTNYYSELPREGETEVWEIVNLTADAHPIHLHLVQFQILDRQAFDTGKYGAAYAAAFPPPAPGGVGVYVPAYGPPKDYRAALNPLSGGKEGGNPDVAPYLKSRPQPPAAHEAGWKDTVMTLPGQVTRIAVRWAPTSLPASTTPADAFFPFDPAAGGHGYVWHCHIIDHEDNEMMRPDLVTGTPGAVRTYVQGIDY